MAEFRLIFLAIMLVIVGSIASVKFRENYENRKTEKVIETLSTKETRAPIENTQIKEK